MPIAYTTVWLCLFSFAVLCLLFRPLGRSADPEGSIVALREILSDITRKLSLALWRCLPKSKLCRRSILRAMQFMLLYSGKSVRVRIVHLGNAKYHHEKRR